MSLTIEEIEKEMSEFKTPATDEYEEVGVLSYKSDMVAPSMDYEQIEVEFKEKATGKSIYCACEGFYDTLTISWSPISNSEKEIEFIETYEGLEAAEESKYYEVFYKTYKALLGK